MLKRMLIRPKQGRATLREASLDQVEVRFCRQRRLGFRLSTGCLCGLLIGMTAVGSGCASSGDHLQPVTETKASHFKPSVSAPVYSTAPEQPQPVEPRQQDLTRLNFLLLAYLNHWFPDLKQPSHPGEVPFIYVLGLDEGTPEQAWPAPEAPQKERVASSEQVIDRLDRLLGHYTREDWQAAQTQKLGLFRHLGAGVWIDDQDRLHIQSGFGGLPLAAFEVDWDHLEIQGDEVTLPIRYLAHALEHLDEAFRFETLPLDHPGLRAGFVKLRYHATAEDVWQRWQWLDTDLETP